MLPSGLSPQRFQEADRRLLRIKRAADFDPGGRRCFLMVDHLELYRPGEGHRLDNYPISPAGRCAFLDDVERMKHQRDVLIFSGGEVFEGELDTGLEWEAMRQVEAIGWHISHLKGKRPPDGKLLVHRARQIKEVQKQLPVPMILLHPFTPRTEGLRRNRDAKAIPAADYQYFRGDEQKELIDLLEDSSIYIEINPPPPRASRPPRWHHRWPPKRPPAPATDSWPPAPYL